MRNDKFQLVPIDLDGNTEFTNLRDRNFHGDSGEEYEL